VEFQGGDRFRQRASALDHAWSLPSSRSVSVACVLARIHRAAETPAANRISKPARDADGKGTEGMNKQAEERQETTDGKRSITRFPDPPLGARLCIFAFRGGCSASRGNCTSESRRLDTNIVSERGQTRTKEGDGGSCAARTQRRMENGSRRKEGGREGETDGRGGNCCRRGKAARLSANFWKTGKSW
jgi:hypothetical protein